MNNISVNKWSVFFAILWLAILLRPAFSASVTRTSLLPLASSKAMTTIPVSPSVEITQIKARRQDINTEEKALEKLKDEVLSEKNNRDRKLSKLQEGIVTEALLDQARLTRESARVNKESVQLDLNNAIQQERALQSILTDLQHQLDVPPGKEDNQLATLQQQMTTANSLLTLDHNYVDLLTKHLTLSKKKADLSDSWLQSITAVYQQQQKIWHQESLEDMKRHLQEQEKNMQMQSLQLQKDLAALAVSDPSTANKREFINRRLEALKESLNVEKNKVTIQEMKSEFDGMNLIQLDTFPVTLLQKDMKKLRLIAGQLEPLITLTSARLNVLQERWALLQKQYALKNISKYLFRKEKKILTDLIDQFTSLLATMNLFNTDIQENLDRVGRAYAKTVQQSLTARQPMPHDLATWKNLLTECSTIPQSLENIVKKSANEIHSGWFHSSTDQKLIFIGGVLLLVFFAFALGRCTKGKCMQLDGDMNYFIKFKLVGRSLLRGSRFSIVLGGTLLLAGWNFQVDTTTFRIFLVFVIIGVVLQSTIKISYWFFASPLVPPEQQQPRLHHMVIWVAGFSAFFTLLVGLVNTGLFTMQLRAVVDQLFMVLLLLIVYFFLRLRTILISAMDPDKRVALWGRLLAIASFSIPLTALAASLVGLAGYVNLAWFVAGQLALFLGVIITWLVARDLVRALLDNWEHQLERTTRRHDLKASVFMSSLQRVLELLLLLVALWVLARLYGWGTGTAVATFLKTGLNYTLFHIGKQEITLINLLTSLFLFLFFFYLSSLARHLTYAWLYRNINDRGLRNSLSVFTQYAVLLIGALVSLDYIGINLTSLTVFAGALGVGIGFGLQNIANNLISGLILLAERPVRVEDWVSVGDSQGLVSRIGLRALVLTTWDNQDIIIPNAQLISAPVTNWTLSNNLIRIVFQVGVRYRDDPHKAQEVIYDAVCMVPEVSLGRKPEIYLTEFSDSSVNFRVQFFSEVDNQHSRLEVKSKVMFAIWDALKDADIGIPFPQQDIYIKELPMGSGPEPPSLEDSSATGSTRRAEHAESCTMD